MDWTKLLDNVFITAVFTGIVALIGALGYSRIQLAKARTLENQTTAAAEVLRDKNATEMRAIEKKCDAETDAIESDTEIKRNAADLARMNEVINSLSQKYRELSESTDKEFEEMRKKIRKLESERQDYADKAHVLRKDLALAEEKITALELRISDFETQLIEKSSQLAARDLRIEALLIDLERTRKELEEFKRESKKL